MAPTYYTSRQAAELQFKRDREAGRIEKRLWFSWEGGEFPPDFRRAYFGQERSSGIRAAALDAGDSAYQGFAFISGGCIRQLSFPSLQAGPNGVELVGSLNDVLDKPELVSLPASLRTQWIVSVVSQKMNEGCEGNCFPLVSAGWKPDVVPGPYVLADDGETWIDGEPPGFYRIDFPAEVHGYCDPTFALLPVLMPVPRGMGFPAKHPVDQPFDEREYQYFHEMEVWRWAMQWQIEKVGGVSCHHPENPMFDTSKVGVDDSVLACFDLSLGNIDVVYTPLLPGSPLYQLCAEDVRLRTEEAWKRLTPDSVKRKHRDEELVTGFVRRKRTLTEDDLVRLQGEIPYWVSEEADSHNERMSERFCLKYMIIGMQCEYGDRCNFEHVHRERFKDEKVFGTQNQKNLREWILRKNDEIEFTRGCLPESVSASE